MTSERPNLKNKFNPSLLIVTFVLYFGGINSAHSDEKDDFVEANILGIFYHELGHALIDIERIPIFGQEEDAADTFSIYLIDALFEGTDAESLAYDAAIGFWAEAEQRSKTEDEPIWWDVHGPDEQRYFNTVCLFYGADPEQRAEYAEDLGLPQERAEYCAEEYDQADASWGQVFDELLDRGPGETLTLSGDSSTITYEILESEIAALNGSMSLDSSLAVIVEECDEANAFYDPELVEIVMCTEFETHLYDLSER